MLLIKNSKRKKGTNSKQKSFSFKLPQENILTVNS